MNNALDRFSVKVIAISDELWLYLRERDGDGWRVMSRGWPHEMRWRVRGGQYIVPSMWFKPLGERIHVAVGYAVEVVRGKLAKEQAGVDADALAKVWNAVATVAFARAFKEAGK